MYEIDYNDERLQGSDILRIKKKGVTESFPDRPLERCLGWRAKYLSPLQDWWLRRGKGSVSDAVANGTGFDRRRLLST